MKKIKVTLIKSLIARLDSHIQSVHGLGLRKIRQSVVVADTPSNRGMINRAWYLLNVEEVK
jgi:large subunit ribosomal protein L30